MHPKEGKARTQTDIRTHVHDSLIHNRQKVEATQVSKDGWMDKQNVVYTHNGILLILKKNWNSGTCYNMDGPWRYYAKWKKPDTKQQISYDAS